MGKENRGTISCSLFEVEDHKKLEAICKLFIDNKQKQSLVLLGMPEIEQSETKELIFSTIIQKDLDSAIALATNRDRYIYIKQNGIEIPISSVGIITARKNHCYIKTKNHDNLYQIQNICSMNETYVLIENTIKISNDKRKNKIMFTLLDYREKKYSIINKTAKLILAIINSEWLEVNGIRLFDGGNPFQNQFSMKFIQHLELIVELGEKLQDVKFPLEIFTVDEILNSITLLNKIHNGLYYKEPVKIEGIEDDRGIFYQVIGSKKIIVEYNRLGEELFEINDYLRNGKYIAIYEPKTENKPEEKNRISNWFAIIPETATEVIFDKEKLINDMLKEGSERDIQHLNLFVLEYIRKYDLLKNNKYLNMASRLIEVIEKKSDFQQVNYINKCQIKYRNNELKDDDIQVLTKIKVESENMIVKCCICILLKQLDEFELLFANLRNVEQEEFKKWPIYNLK